MMMTLALTLTLAAAGAAPPAAATLDDNDIAHDEAALAFAVDEAGKLQLRSRVLLAQAEEETPPDDDTKKREPATTEITGTPTKPAKGKSTTSKTAPAAAAPKKAAGAPQFPGAGAASTPMGRQLGVGLQLGYPTALTLKYMLAADSGIVAGIGGLNAFAYDNASFTVYVDYVVHPHLLTGAEPYQVTWYVGGGVLVHVFNGYLTPRLAFGGRVQFYTPFWIAAHVPIGVNLALTGFPVEIYLQADPTVLVFPPIAFGLGASIGARYYF